MGKKINRNSNGEHRIIKPTFETKEKKDEEMVQIFCLLNGDKVLNRTFVPASQAKDFQLIKR